MAQSLARESRQTKVLSHVPDPLNLFKDSELPSLVPYQVTSSSCGDQVFSRQQFPFIHFPWWLQFFFLIYLRAFSLTYKTAQCILHSLGRSPPKPLFGEVSVCWGLSSSVGSLIHLTRGQLGAMPAWASTSPFNEVAPIWMIRSHWKLGTSYKCKMPFIEKCISYFRMCPVIFF